MVSIHEKEKNVTIVLNQHGAFKSFTTDEFCEHIFTPTRQEQLKELGYGILSVKGAENAPRNVLSSIKGERSLTIILRPFFKPNDMKNLQLASERLLATGDNTAAESFAARCGLYVYEDVANLGCKTQFLQQQVQLAHTISPNVGTLLSLFGKRGDFSEENRAHVIEILQDPYLKEKTFHFCNLIVKNYSFQKILQGALKRFAWHQALPTLMHEEIASLDPSFKEGLVDFFKNAHDEDKILTLNNISFLKQTIEQNVREKLNQDQRSC
jgi:hypothetical protein